VSHKSQITRHMHPQPERRMQRQITRLMKPQLELPMRPQLNFDRRKRELLGPIRSAKRPKVPFK